MGVPGPVRVTKTFSSWISMLPSPLLYCLLRGPTTNQAECREVRHTRQPRGSVFQLPLWTVNRAKGCHYCSTTTSYPTSTEGFDSADLQETKALLEASSPHYAPLPRWERARHGPGVTRPHCSPAVVQKCAASPASG